MIDYHLLVVVFVVFNALFLRRIVFWTSNNLFKCFKIEFRYKFGVTKWFVVSTILENCGSVRQHLSPRSLWNSLLQTFLLQFLHITRKKYLKEYKQGWRFIRSLKVAYFWSFPCSLAHMICIQLLFLAQLIPSLLTFYLMNLSTLWNEFFRSISAPTIFQFFVCSRLVLFFWARSPK